jgi:hypothetical protein
MSTWHPGLEETKADLATEKPDAWDRIMADPKLDRARSKLSIHDLRTIIGHVRAEPAPPQIGADVLKTMEAILRLVEAPGIHTLYGMTRSEWVAYARPQITYARAALTPKD